jgi:hypothetical protein
MIAPPRPPRSDELELLIKEARARQRRRQLLGVAGIAILAGLGLGLYALVGGFSHARRTENSTGGGPALCRSSQLSTSATFGASAGSVFFPVVMTNASSQTCALPEGVPHLQILFRGKPVPIKEKSWSTSLRDFGKPAGHLLAPGRNAFVELLWSDFLCPRPAAAPRTGSVVFVLRFPDGLRVTAPESSPDVPGPALPGCGEVVRPQPVVAVSRPLTLVK